MATAQAILGVRILDDAGVSKAYEEYVTFDDATATLAGIKTAIDSRLEALDNVTDGQILSVGFKIFFALPAGLKSAPVADCDVEETGLFSFVTSGPTGKTYSEDVPAVASSIVVGRTIDIDTGGQPGTAYVTTLTGTGGTLRNTDDKWAYTLNSGKSGQKTFRKSRKALKRA